VQLESELIHLEFVNGLRSDFNFHCFIISLFGGFGLGLLGGLVFGLFGGLSGGFVLSLPGFSGSFTLSLSSLNVDTAAVSMAFFTVLAHSTAVAMGLLLVLVVVAAFTSAFVIAFFSLGFLFLDGRGGSRSASFASFSSFRAAQELLDTLSLDLKTHLLSKFRKLFGVDVLSLEELLKALHHGASSVSARASGSTGALTLLLVELSKLLFDEGLGDLHAGFGGHGRKVLRCDVFGFHELLDNSQPRLVGSEVGSSSFVVVWLVFSFRESSLDEVDGHFESSGFGVFVNLFSRDLGFLDQVLEHSNPFLAFVTRASMASSSSAAVSTESTGSSAVMVSRESFLHVAGITAHVEGGVLFVVVVSLGVHVLLLLFVY
jgi:hypothetical protein